MALESNINQLTVQLANSMPSTRLTIALNTNRNQRAPLLLPSPPSPSTSEALIIKTATSKLRLKKSKVKAPRIFHAKTGTELSASSTLEEWSRLCIDDSTLLVSSGEDYVGSGVPTSDPPTSSTEKPATIINLSHHAYVDPLSLTQLETTASTLPGIIHATAQPDLHPGTKFPIGAVFVSKGWIHPPLIGGDIGCGMAWYRTKLTAAQVEGEKGRKVAEKLRGVEGAWSTPEARRAWLRKPSAEPDV